MTDTAPTEDAASQRVTVTRLAALLAHYAGEEFDVDEALNYVYKNEATGQLVYMPPAADDAPAEGAGGGEAEDTPTTEGPATDEGSEGAATNEPAPAPTTAAKIATKRPAARKAGSAPAAAKTVDHMSEDDLISAFDAMVKEETTRLVPQR